MRFIWGHRLIRAIVLTVLLDELPGRAGSGHLPGARAGGVRRRGDLGLMYGVVGGAGLVGALTYSAIGHRLPRR